MYTRNCARCGTKFVLKNIAYEKMGKGKFCSRECATRKLEFNDRFFDVIDTEQKAYWLGFIFAEGSIKKK